MRVEQAMRLRWLGAALVPATKKRKAAVKIHTRRRILQRKISIQIRDISGKISRIPWNTNGHTGTSMLTAPCCLCLLPHDGTTWSLPIKGILVHCLATRRRRFYFLWTPSDWSWNVGNLLCRCFHSAAKWNKHAKLQIWPCCIEYHERTTSKHSHQFKTVLVEPLKMSYLTLRLTGRYETSETTDDS